jgi:TolB-like protein/DNA-binding winged helix-turn-helix (wHTH) protein
MIYRFSDVELDRQHFELRRQGEPVHLEPRVLDLLLYLVEHRDRMIPKDELLEQVWSGQVVTESSLTRCISLAREAIGDEGREGLIRTVHGRGYDFHGEVEQVPPASVAGPGEGAATEEINDPGSPRSRRAPAGPVRWAVAGLVLAVTAVAGWRLLASRSSESELGGATSIRSLAVLPLENLSGDPQHEYFADAMTEALIGDLANIGSLRVVSRTSAMRYKNSDLSLPEIAFELGVDGVLEGSVFREDPRVRISVQLIDAVGDTHIWSESYERGLEDQLRVHGDVARSVAQAIAIELTPAEQERLASGYRVDPRAQDAYLMGRLHQGRISVADRFKAIEYYEQAIAIDPRYASPHQAMAGAYIMLGWGLRHLPPREAMPRARAAAEEALRLDPTMVEPHVTLAIVLGRYEWQWEAAEAEFQLLHELVPDGLHREHGLFLIAIGQHDEGLALLEQGVRQPRGFQAYERGVLATSLVQARRYEEAIEQAQLTIEMLPDLWWPHWALATAYRFLGRDEEAFRAYEGWYRLTHDEEWLASHADAYRRGGLEGSLRYGLESELRDGGDTLVIAGLSAAVGDYEAAFDWLEEAWQERHLDLVSSLVNDQDFDPMRSDPRFRDLLRRINYPQ